MRARRRYGPGRREHRPAAQRARPAHEKPPVRGPRDRSGRRGGGEVRRARARASRKSPRTPAGEVFSWGSRTRPARSWTTWSPRRPGTRPWRAATGARAAWPRAGRRCTSSRGSTKPRRGTSPTRKAKGEKGRVPRVFISQGETFRVQTARVLSIDTPRFHRRRRSASRPLARRATRVDRDRTRDETERRFVVSARGRFANRRRLRRPDAPRVKKSLAETSPLSLEAGTNDFCLRSGAVTRAPS